MEILITNITVENGDNYQRKSPWLKDFPHIIKKAINDNGTHDTGFGIVTIIDDNTAEMYFHDNNTIERCNFVRKKWALRKEVFWSMGSDTHYPYTLFDSPDEAVKEYLRLKPLVHSKTHEIYSLYIVEVWI